MSLDAPQSQIAQYRKFFPKIRKYPTYFGLLPVVLFAAISGAANAEVLNFNSLPSAQGYTYDSFGNSLTESQVFSLSSGVLHMDTSQAGFQGQGDNIYYESVPSSGIYLDASITVRVTQEFGGDSHNHGGFAFVIGWDDQYQVAMQLGSSELQDTLYNDYPVDGTQYHTYQIFADPLGRVDKACEGDSSDAA